MTFRKAINVAARGFAYVLSLILAIIEFYAICFALTCMLSAVVMTVWSFFTVLPECIISRFGLIMITVSVFPALIAFVTTLIKVKMTEKRKARELKEAQERG